MHGLLLLKFFASSVFLINDMITPDRLFGVNRPKSSLPHHNMFWLSPLLCHRVDIGIPSNIFAVKQVLKKTKGRVGHEII